MPEKIGLIAKAIGGCAVAVLMAVIAARGLDSEAAALITGVEWLQIVAVGLASAGAVWAIPMGWVSGVGKAVTAALAAAVGALILGGAWPPSGDAWLTAVIALLGALGVTYAVPNAPWSDGAYGLRINVSEVMGGNPTVVLETRGVVRSDVDQANRSTDGHRPLD